MTFEFRIFGEAIGYSQPPALEIDVTFEFRIFDEAIGYSQPPALEIDVTFEFRIFDEAVNAVQVYSMCIAACHHTAGCARQAAHNTAHP